MVEETRSALEAARGEEQAEPHGFIDQIWTKFTSNVQRTALNFDETTQPSVSHNMWHFSKGTFKQ